MGGLTPALYVTAMHELEAGGAFIFSHYLPYDDVDAAAWSRWLPSERGVYPREWPAEGQRPNTANGMRSSWSHVVEDLYRGQPATPKDSAVVFVAMRPDA